MNTDRKVIDAQVRTYLFTAGALIVLLGATVGMAFAPLGAWSPVVGLGIASIKATLVAVVFMHLSRSSGLARIFAAGGLFWLAILIGLALTDYLMR